MHTLLPMEIDQDVFDRNLLLTQAYCELQSQKYPNKSIAEIFRSYNPTYNNKSLFTYKAGYKPSAEFPEYLMNEWTDDPLSDRNLYNELFKNQLDNKIEVTQAIAKEKKFEGRILVAGIDLTEVDGGAHVYSLGFVDGNDCPPIDTWFYMVNAHNGRILFSWIPAQFEDVANQAIGLNLSDCLTWIDNYNPTNWRIHQY